MDLPLRAASCLQGGKGLCSTDLERESSSWGFDPHKKWPPRHLATGTLESEKPAVFQLLLSNSCPGEVCIPSLPKPAGEESLQQITGFLPVS